MRIECKIFGLHKDGHDCEDYEDAYAYKLEHGRFAIADGATESSFAKQWAKLLVGGFIDNPAFFKGFNAQSVKLWLTPLQNKWHQSIDWEKLPYFGEEKAKLGASSTLLGLQLDLYRNCNSLYPWYGMAVGDSCLFQLRGDHVLEKYPLSNSHDFNNSPFLLSSNAKNNERLWPDNGVVFSTSELRHLWKSGQYQAGDIFFLATDALSQWILKQCETGEEPWKVLFNFENLGKFQEFVDTQRREKSMHNDDTTLMIIRVLQE